MSILSLQRAGRPLHAVAGARYALGVLLVLAAACSGEPRAAHDEEMRMVVQVVRATPTTLPRAIPSVGSLKSPQMTTVAAELPGIVRSIDIPEGKLVEKGYVLARLDDGEAKAAVAVEVAKHAEAKSRFERVQALHASRVASGDELDVVEAVFEASVGALDEARTRLEKMTIRAPFDGVIGLRDSGIYAGQVLSAGQPIVQITRSDALEVVFHVPQGNAADVRVGQAILGIEGACGRRFTGTVAAVDPRIDPDTRMMQVLGMVPAEDDAGLLPGMAVRLRVAVGEIADAVVIPQEAVVRQGTKNLAYVVDDKQEAVSREIEVGEYFVDGVHVLSGILAGEMVVAAGQQKLRPGAPVKSEPYRSTENPNLELGWLGPPGDCVL